MWLLNSVQVNVFEDTLSQLEGNLCEGAEDGPLRAACRGTRLRLALRLAPRPAPRTSAAGRLSRRSASPSRAHAPSHNPTSQAVRLRKEHISPSRYCLAFQPVGVFILHYILAFCLAYYIFLVLRPPYPILIFLNSVCFLNGHYNWDKKNVANPTKQNFE